MRFPRDETLMRDTELARRLRIRSGEVLALAQRGAIEHVRCLVPILGPDKQPHSVCSVEQLALLSRLAGRRDVGPHCPLVELDFYRYPHGKPTPKVGRELRAALQSEIALKRASASVETPAPNRILVNGQPVALASIKDVEFVFGEGSELSAMVTAVYPTEGRVELELEIKDAKPLQQIIGHVKVNAQ